MSSDASTRGAPTRGADAGVGIGEENTAYPDTAPGSADYATSVQPASGLLFLAGVWLVVAPWVLGFERAGASVHQSVAVGAALAAVATVRLALPLTTRRLTWVAFALGLGAICAPFLAGHPIGDERTRVLWNGIVTGALAVAVAAHAVAVDDRAQRSLSRRSR